MNADKINEKVSRAEVINIQITYLEEEIGNKYQQVALVSKLVAEHKSIEFKLKQSIRINTINHKIIQKQLIALKAAEDIRKSAEIGSPESNEYYFQTAHNGLKNDIEGIKKHSAELRLEISIQHSQARDHQESRYELEKGISGRTNKIIELTKEQNGIYTELNGFNALLTKTQSTTEFTSRFE